MTISVTNIGVGSGGNAATSATLTTGANIPAGAVIFVGGTANSGETCTSVTDGTNTYTQQVSHNTTGPCVGLFSSSILAAQLNSGATLTINFSASNNGWSRAMSAAYATGLSSATADKTSSGGAVSGTSINSGATATLTQNVELAVGFAGWQDSTQSTLTVTETSSFTALNTQNVDNATGGTNTGSHMAFFITSSTSAVTYSGTLSASAADGNGALVATFLATVLLFPMSFDPHFDAVRKKRSSPEFWSAPAFSSSQSVPVGPWFDQPPKKKIAQLWDQFGFAPASSPITPLGMFDAPPRRKPVPDWWSSIVSATPINYTTQSFYDTRKPAKASVGFTDVPVKPVQSFFVGTWFDQPLRIKKRDDLWWAFSGYLFSHEFITSTAVIQLPINAILAGQQDYEMGPSQIDAREPNVKVRVMMQPGPKIHGEASTFTTRTDNKGYD